jgi:O-antigen/teichoic acid export membrane protein
LRSWVAGVIENTRGTFEAIMVINFGGNTLLGNYNHARTYQYLLTQTTNAVANVLWPIALNEANNQQSDFSRIRTPWNLVYLGLTCVGIGAVLLGHELINFLTHEKFTQVSVLLPWLVIYVLLQNAGKPATAILFAFGKGNVYSTIRIASLVFSLLSLWLFVPLYGIFAVVVILNLEMLLTRIFITYFARSYREIHFHDSWVLMGCLFIIGVWWVDNLVDFSLSYRVSIFLFILLLISLVASCALWRKKLSYFFLRG